MTGPPCLGKPALPRDPRDRPSISRPKERNLVQEAIRQFSPGQHERVTCTQESESDASRAMPAEEGGHPRQNGKKFSGSTCLRWAVVRQRSAGNRQPPETCYA